MSAFDAALNTAAIVRPISGIDDEIALKTSRAARAGRGGGAGREAERRRDQGERPGELDKRGRARAAQVSPPATETAT